MDTDEALQVFLGTDALYGGGLANHGPMAVEALAHLGVPHWIGPFVDDYRPRLESPAHDVASAPDDWREWLRPRLDALVPAAASQAGHGLLRVAHAVRGLETAEAAGNDTSLRLCELGAAVTYWETSDSGIDGPAELTGLLAVDEWLATLGPAGAIERPDGLLTLTLFNASQTSGFTDRVAALASSPEHTTTLDALSAAAAKVFRRNTGGSAFAILHGATVSAMASTLIPHLNDAGQRRLVASVAGFVAAAIMGFDDELDTPESNAAPAPAELAELAGASKEDHTIKFTDACISVAQRSGDLVPLAAAFQQIQFPYGLR